MQTEEDHLRWSPGCALRDTKIRQQTGIEEPHRESNQHGNSCSPVEVTRLPAGQLATNDGNLDGPATLLKLWLRSADM